MTCLCLWMKVMRHFIIQVGGGGFMGNWFCVGC